VLTLLLTLAPLNKGVARYEPGGLLARDTVSVLEHRLRGPRVRLIPEHFRLDGFVLQTVLRTGQIQVIAPFPDAANASFDRISGRLER
jgi:hypothetical protein